MRRYTLHLFIPSFTMWPVGLLPINVSSLFHTNRIENDQSNLPQDAPEHAAHPPFNAIDGSNTESQFEVETLTSYSVSPYTNFISYVVEAMLPPLELGVSAPPIIPRGHRTHLNRLAVTHAAHRIRFQNIMPLKDFKHFYASAIKCRSPSPTCMLLILMVPTSLSFTTS